MFLSLLNVPDDLIIADYALSRRYLSSSRGILLTSVGKLGLGPEYADCPPKEMEKTLQIIKVKWGSVEEYLGLNPERFYKLKRICIHE